MTSPLDRLLSQASRTVGMLDVLIDHGVTIPGIDHFAEHLRKYRDALLHAVDAAVPSVVAARGEE